MPFIPHTAEDVEIMLATTGAKTIEELFDEIPTSLSKAKLENIPQGLSELEITRLMQERAPNIQQGSCFIGAGAYEHYIPAAVWEITSRGEFYTAYTPYQAEASQGTLQLIYEYQTMMANLMGMEVANASLYDGATALVEAILMALRLKNNSAKRILVPATLNPLYRQTLKTMSQFQEMQLEEIAYQQATGTIDFDILKNLDMQNVAAIIIPQPNFFGMLEDVDELTAFANQHSALCIAVVNPLAMALLKEPGRWGSIGADIVCGEGQPLGIPLAAGGPYFGFLCCKKAYVRQMPGRIVGRTHDAQGREGFTLTLQTREQHIRRTKATSNICTNQGLMVTAATIYLSLMGEEGLRRVATLCHQRAVALLNLIRKLPSVKTVFNGTFFHEFVVQFNKPAEHVLKQLADYGIQAGYALNAIYPELGDSLLICATETKTQQDLERYYELLAKALS